MVEFNFTTMSVAYASDCPLKSMLNGDDEYSNNLQLTNWPTNVKAQVLHEHHPIPYITLALTKYE